MICAVCPCCCVLLIKTVLIRVKAWHQTGRRPSPDPYSWGKHGKYGVVDTGSVVRFHDISSVILTDNGSEKTYSKSLLVEVALKYIAIFCNQNCFCWLPSIFRCLGICRHSDDQVRYWKEESCRVIFVNSWNNVTTLFMISQHQVMLRYRQETSHYLNHCWPRLLTHYSSNLGSELIHCSCWWKQFS